MGPIKKNMYLYYFLKVVIQIEKIRKEFFNINLFIVKNKHFVYKDNRGFIILINNLFKQSVL